MIKNYLLIAVRNIKRHRFFSYLNIAGLAIGMACSFLIFVWVKDEFSYDRFHLHEKDLYRLVCEVENADALFKAVVTPFPAPSYLNDEIPEILSVTSLRPFSRKILVEYNSGDEDGYTRKFYEDKVIAADSNFFDHFTFEFIKGDPEKAITGINSVVITESIASKYFGDEDPVGKTLTMFNKSWVGNVTAVLKDPPLNSHIRFDFIIPFGNLFGQNLETEWGNYYYNGYILLSPGTSPEVINQKIEEALKKRSSDSEVEIRMYLQAMRDVHLKSDFDIDYNNSTTEVNSDVYIFSVVAVFILIIACLNFINLTTARSGRRAREIGIRKISGASRFRLIRQFFGESVFIALIAFILGLIIVVSLLQVFNQLTGKSLVYGDILNSVTVLTFLGIAISAGLLSGVYPALLLSSFQPLRVLKKEIQSGLKKSSFRKVLVLIQFSISLILISCVFIVNQQLKYVNNIELGYVKENLIYLPARGAYMNYYESFSSRILQESNIQRVTISSDIPLNTIHLWGGLDWEGRDPDDNTLMNFYTGDFDLIPTLGIQLASGRNFTYNTDSNNYIINETAARIMGKDNPLNQWFSLGENRGIIIGVVKDFNFKSLRTKMEPLVIRVGQGITYIMIRLNEGDIQQSVTLIKNIWDDLNPDYPFEYHFLKEDYQQLYLPEIRLGKLFTYFTLLAIIVSCLGLLGLTSFMSQQRTKEIGVRKVLGSTIYGIIRLFAMEFTKWVIFANVVAIPVAYFLIRKWLQNFAYRTQISWWVFVVAAILALLIALITIGLQSYQAATANPADSLRQE